MRERLRNKIKEDTGIEIPDDALFIRRKLNWNNKSAGCFQWFFVLKDSGNCVGSSDGIRELLKTSKIQFSQSFGGDYELHSS